MRTASDPSTTSRGTSSWDNPWVPAALMLVAALCFCGARLAWYAHGDVSWFVVAGAGHVDPAKLHAGIHVFPRTGYDGQFFYRLALDPASLSLTSHGIRLDSAYRLQRIGYPVLAWLGALGQARLVPWSLIGVNVAGLAALGFLGGLAARGSGRHALWGLLVAWYWGYMFSLSRDVAEIPAAAFLLGGLLALRRKRPVAAGVLLGAAVLTRETAMAVVVGLAVVAVADIWSSGYGRRRPVPPELAAQQWAWLVPLTVFTAWLAVVRHVSGNNPTRADTGANLGLPFVAMVRAAGHDLATLGDTTSRLAVAELVVLALIMTAAITAWRHSTAPAGERVGWVLLAGLVVSLSSAVWAGQADFRSLDQLYMLSVLIVLGTDRRLGGTAALVGGAWVMVALRQATFL